MERKADQKVNNLSLKIISTASLFYTNESFKFKFIFSLKGIYTRGCSKMFDIMVPIVDFCHMSGKLVEKIAGILENHYVL